MYILKPTSFPWPQGIRGAVSLSFDDARPSQLDNGIPLLNAHGVRGTFYASLRPLEKREDDWHAAVKSGHEVGNHTTHHACSGNFHFGSPKPLEEMTLEEIGSDLDNASAEIEEYVGVRPVTFAYPCGHTFVGRGTQRRSYVPVAAHKFLAARGFREEFVNDPAFCDLHWLAGSDVDRLTAPEVLPVLERVRDTGYWIIFAGHDVATSGKQATLPSTLEAICDFCKNRANGLWIDTVANIARYVDEKRKSSAATHTRH